MILQNSFMEFSWLYLSALVYVPYYGDAMNEILDLQRELHAHDFALCEEEGTPGVLVIFALRRGT